MRVVREPVVSLAVLVISISVEDVATPLIVFLRGCIVRSLSRSCFLYDAYVFGWSGLSVFRLFVIDCTFLSLKWLRLGLSPLMRGWR